MPRDGSSADEWISVAAAAKLAYVSGSTIRRWITAGALAVQRSSTMWVSQAQVMRIATNPAKRHRIRALLRNRRVEVDPRQLPLFADYGEAKSPPMARQVIKAYSTVPSPKPA